MGQALVFGLIGSSALVIGGAIGTYWRAPQQISGVLLAFASGRLHGDELATTSSDPSYS